MMLGVVLMDKSGRRALLLVPPVTFKKSKQNSSYSVLRTELWASFFAHVFEPKCEALNGMEVVAACTDIKILYDIKYL
ncbi:hypothetical protein Hanom_Chr16g01497361 [Helianthus anomalus]